MSGPYLPSDSQERDSTGRSQPKSGLRRLVSETSEIGAAQQTQARRRVSRIRWPMSSSIGQGSRDVKGALVYKSHC